MCSDWAADCAAIAKLNIRSTWPPITASIAGLLPRNGTSSSSALAVARSMAQPIEPTPPLMAQLTLPGLAFIWASSSGTVLAGKAAEASRMNGPSAR